MIKIIGLTLIILLGVALTPHASGNKDRYCPLMFAIYGVCSPELIDNYLAHTESLTPRLNRETSVQQDQARTSSTPLTIPVEEPNPTEIEEVKSDCWYYTPSGWKTCRIIA